MTALRQAFDSTMKDPEFLADAQKAKLDIEPITGNEMGALVGNLFKLSPVMANKLNNILSPK